MRLTSDEINAITDCAARHFGAGSVVRLFGSRVHDDLRGGDIDLHVIAETAERATLQSEGAFLAALEERIGEQRIDVLLLAPGERFRPIDDIAVATGISLALSGGIERREGGPGLAAASLRDGSGPPPYDRQPNGTRSMADARAQLLDDAVVAGRAVRERLIEALAFVEPRLPLGAEDLEELDRPGRLELDSLIVCFSNLVAVVQDQLIRSILVLEEEWSPRLTRIDQRNLVEKLGGLPPGLAYEAMIDTRNALAHLYPHRPDRQAEAVNAIAAASRTALAAFEGLAAYAEGLLIRRRNG